MNDSVYEAMRKRGCSPQEFQKMCTILTATIGLENSFIPRVAHALKTKPRLPVIYLNLQECTCCAESFIKPAHPLFADMLFNMISLDYMEPLQAVAGYQAEAAKQKTIQDYKDQYLVVVEGSIPLKDDGIYCTIGGVAAQDILMEAAKNSIAVIAYGSCATNTCVQGASPNPTGAVPVNQVVTDKAVINVPGCPPIAEVIAGVIVYYLTFDRLPELTESGRPKAFYNHRIHQNCNRRGFFDRGMFVKNFDDNGAKQGWCLFQVGCKGPSTYNACAITQWNNGVSYPIKSGHPCIGCSEAGYFDRSMYSREADNSGRVLPFDPEWVNKTLVRLSAAAARVMGRIRPESGKKEGGEE